MFYFHAVYFSLYKHAGTCVLMSLGIFDIHLIEVVDVALAITCTSKIAQPDSPMFLAILFLYLAMAAAFISFSRAPASMSENLSKPILIAIDNPILDQSE